MKKTAHNICKEWRSIEFGEQDGNINQWGEEIRID
jgi:hypothetical protein